MLINTLNLSAIMIFQINSMVISLLVIYFHYFTVSENGTVNALGCSVPAGYTTGAQ